MKNLYLLTLVAAVLLSGCATMTKCPPGDTACLEAERAREVAMWADDLRDIASAGAAYYLSQDPASRAKIQLVITALKTLETSERLTIADIASAFVKAGLTDKFESPKGQLYWTAGRLILRRVGGDIGTQNPSEVRKLAGALRQGLELVVTP